MLIAQRREGDGAGSGGHLSARRSRYCCGAYFEYSSTISCSWTGVSITWRAGTLWTRMRSWLLMTSSHGGTGRSPARAWAISKGSMRRDFSETSMMSLELTRYDGMSTLRPLTRMWPWRTSWRATATSG